VENTPYYCKFLIKIGFSGPIFKKFLKIKFDENPSSGSRVVSCGTAVEGSDLIKLIVAFLNLANATKTQY